MQTNTISKCQKVNEEAQIFLDFLQIHEFSPSKSRHNFSPLARKLIFFRWRLTTQGIVSEAETRFNCNEFSLPFEQLKAKKPEPEKAVFLGAKYFKVSLKLSYFQVTYQNLNPCLRRHLKLAPSIIHFKICELKTLKTTGSYLLPILFPVYKEPHVL